MGPVIRPRALKCRQEAVVDVDRAQRPPLAECLAEDLHGERRQVASSQQHLLGGAPVRLAAAQQAH